MSTPIHQKVAEHLKMAAFHNKEATRLIESLEGEQSPSSRKGRSILSVDLKAKLIANSRKRKGTGIK